MLSAFPLLALAAVASAKTVTYNFEIGWVNRCPDGYCRPVIGINNQWPIPTIEADEGDTIVVNAKNSLGNETTSLHFHGMYQAGTPQSDGPVGVAQCPIQPGSSYTYTFTASPAGTHWYHSHDRGQYPDGLRGLMIIHDPSWESTFGVESQIYLSISDWYHDQMPGMIHTYLDPSNSAGVFPTPNTVLVNETNQPPAYNFKAGKKYMLRIANVAAVACQKFAINGLKLTIVGIDGVEVQPTESDSLLLCASQRYTVIVTAPSNPMNSIKYAVQMQTDMFTQIPSGLTTVISGTVNLVSGLLGSILGLLNTQPDFSSLSPVDDFNLKPLDNQGILTPVARTINMVVNQTDFPGVGSRYQIGNAPWVEPQVPSLFTALTTGSSANQPSIYGAGVAPYVLNYNDVIQIYLVNGQTYPHPMHMHGHEYQLVARGTGTWNGDDSGFPSVPMKRDTVTVPAGGYIVIRFQANNPGVWFFHCHIDWHLVAGMAATLIEAPTKIQQSVTSQNIATCQADGNPTSGNCQGSTTNLNDTSKCNTVYTFSPNNGALTSTSSSKYARMAYRPRSNAPIRVA